MLDKQLLFWRRVRFGCEECEGRGERRWFAPGLMVGLVVGLVGGLILAGCAPREDLESRAPAAPEPEELASPLISEEPLPGAEILPSTEPLEAEQPTRALAIVDADALVARFDSERVYARPFYEDDRLTIALMLPRGRVPQLASSLANAAEIALFDSGNEKATLRFYDSGSSPGDSVESFRRAVDEGADLVLGPVFSENVAALTDESLENGVPLFAMSTRVDLAQRGVWLVARDIGGETEQLIDYMRSAGHRQLALISTDDAWGRTVLKAALEAVEGRDMRLGHVALIDPTSEDPSVALRKITDYFGRRDKLTERKETLRARGDDIGASGLEALAGVDAIGDPPFDAIILSVRDGRLLRTVAGVLALIDVDSTKAQIWSLSDWRQLTNLGAERLLKGARFVAPPAKNWASFSALYARDYEGVPPELAFYFYDAARLVMAAGADGRLNLEQLESPRGFVGSAGLLRLTERGRAERLLSLWQVRSSGDVEIVTAPSQFVTSPQDEASPLSADEQNPDAALEGVEFDVLSP